MNSVKYKLKLIKKSAKINKINLSVFVKDVLREFGRNCLLTNIKIDCDDHCIIKIEADKENMIIAQAAFALCGSYKSIGCCFIEV